MSIPSYSKLLLEKCFYGIWLPSDIHKLSNVLLQVSEQNKSCDWGMRQTTKCYFGRNSRQMVKILSFTLSLIFLPFGTTTENRSPQHCSQSLHHSVILRLLRNTSRRIQGSDHVLFFNISVQMAVSFPCYKQGWTSQKQFVSFYLTLEPGGLPFLWILSCPFIILEAKVLTPTWRW